jgi:MFS transporter, SET family, sugar efflux transporter
VTPLVDTPAGPSALRDTLASPLYRGATMALFLSGLGFSGAAPQIALFLVNYLHVPLTMAGLYYLTNLTAPVVGYLVGARSDRTGKRLGLFRLCACAGFLGWLAIALSTRAWMPFVISAVVLAFAGAASSQLFAAVHDDLQANESPVADGVTSIVRMALTAGWVVGPVLGALLSAAFGLRAMLVATASFTLAQILPLGTMRSPAKDASSSHVEAHNDEPERAVRTRRLHVMLPLLTFTGLFVLVYAGEPIKYAYLPIYMHEDLGLPAVISGAVIGIQPLIELILMPVAVVVARRIGILPLMVVGAAFAVAGNLCFALTGSMVGMFAGQVLMGGVWGIFAGLGIILAQRLLPGAVATASAVFISSTAIASALGGLTGGLGVGALGLPHVFLLPAVYAALATVGIAIMSRSRQSVT